MARALLRQAERAWAATNGNDDPASLPAGKDMSFAVQVLAYLGHLAEAASSDVNEGLPSFGDLPVLMESVLLGAGRAGAVGVAQPAATARAERRSDEYGSIDPHPLEDGEHRRAHAE